MWLRVEHVLREAERVKVCQAAEKGISLLMLSLQDSRRGSYFFFTCDCWYLYGGDG